MTVPSGTPSSRAISSTGFSSKYPLHDEPKRLGDAADRRAERVQPGLRRQLGEKGIGTLGQVQRIADHDELDAPLAQVHPAEIQQNRVEPVEERARVLILRDLANRLVERAEDEFLGVVVITAQQKRGRKKAISVLGNEPFCTAFRIFSDFQPDFHADAQLSCCSKA